MEQDEWKKLIEDLGAFSKPMLDDDRKERMKERLMQSVMARDVKAVAESVKLSQAAKVRLKENVFERMQAPSGFFAFFNPLKKLVSAALAVALFFGVFVYFKPGQNFVSAGEISFINSFEGEVWVYRDGQKISAEVGFELKVGDELLTAEDGVVEVYFFDDSRSQLAPGSRLVINELAELEQEQPGTYVNVSLLDGRVWTKVVDLPEESAFVVEAEGNFVETDKAAFDVKVKNRMVSVGVFNSSVEVKSLKGTEKILSGQKIVFQDDSYSKEMIAENDRTTAWVASNLKIDQDYLIETEKRLITAKIEAIGESFSAETDELFFLNYDDVAEQKESLLLAEKNLVALQYDLTVGSGDQAAFDKAVAEFKLQVEAFYGLVDQVRYTDEKYADSLKSFVDGKVLSYKSDLAATLPTSPSYELKQVINDLEVNTVTDPYEVLELKVSQVEDTISDVDAVKDTASNSTLTKVTQEYTEDVKNVFNEIDSLNTTNLELKEQLKIDLIEDFSVIDSVQKSNYGLTETSDGKVLSPLF